jgi:hypothetical protein
MIQVEFGADDPAADLAGQADVGEEPIDGAPARPQDGQSLLAAFGLVDSQPRHLEIAHDDRPGDRVVLYDEDRALVLRSGFGLHHRRRIGPRH